MSRASAVLIVAATLLVCAGCGTQPRLSAAPTPPAHSASPSLAPSPSAVASLPPTTAPASGARNSCPAGQPAPAFAPTAPSSRSLALVNLNGTNDYVVRDVTDINHPATVSDLGSSVDFATQFVNASELSTTSGGQGLVRMPLSGSPRTLVAACAGNPFAWSPDGTSAAYVRGGAWPAPSRFHIVSGGVDREFDSVPSIPPVGCESRTCADNWQISLLFSPDGAYISLISLSGTFRLWTFAGKLLKSLDGSHATMQVWASGALYWRDDKGVERWRSGAQTLVLPGVQWIRPHASPDGAHIVYETRDAAGTAHVYLYNTAADTAIEIASSRSEPAYLNAGYLWYQGETPCASCPLGPTLVTAYYLRDVTTGVEYRSIITHVWDVWPHTT